MLTNKYSHLYFKITFNAKQRIPAGYTERHHIIPQSLGGSDDKENLVDLTAREHFICHWLLIKMTEGEERGKMLYALQGMKAENKFQNRYRSKITARVYEKYRQEHAENHSKRMKGRKTWNKGVAQTKEHREKNRQTALKRPPKSQETIEKWREARAGYKHSEETKKKQSAKLKGKAKGPQSTEHRLAISLGSKGKKKKLGHGANVAKANIGNVSINKDGLEKKIKKDVLQIYLNDGWRLGGKKRKID